VIPRPRVGYRRSRDAGRTSALKRILALFAILAVVALLVPGSAGAHLQLRSSTPARGDTVLTPLHDVRVTFTQRVDLRFTTLTLVDGTGAIIAQGAEPSDSTLTSFVLKLSAPLHRGEYTVRWRTAGADGHVVDGSFGFLVAADPEPEVAATTKATTAPPQPTLPVTESRDRYTSGTWVATRFLTFASIVLVIGSLAFLVILSHAQRTAPIHDDFWATGAQRTRIVAIIASALAFLAAIPRLLLQSAALHGDRLGLDAAFLASVLDTAWGRGWLLQVGAALAFCFAWLLLRPARSAIGWLVCAGAAIALAVSPGLSGHAAAVTGRPVLPIVLDALHVFGAAAWIGSLAMLLLVALPLALRSGNHEALAVTVATFSPVALIGAAIAASTGVAGAFFHIPSFPELWSTAYGQAVLFKLLAVLAVMSLGAFNWRRVRPRLGDSTGSGTLRVSATTEFALAALVLLITAVLVALPTPL